MMSPFIGVMLFNLFCVTLNEITSEKDDECRNEAHKLIELEISHTFYSKYIFNYFIKYLFFIFLLAV